MVVGTGTEDVVGGRGQPRFEVTDLLGIKPEQIRILGKNHVEQE